jgi:hypothetical protein
LRLVAVDEDVRLGEDVGGRGRLDGVVGRRVAGVREDVRRRGEVDGDDEGERGREPGVIVEGEVALEGHVG